jgi:serine/threonine-protein kinase
MKKIAISGGVPVTITNATITGGPTWYEDDTIVYGQSGIGIMRVSANGGTPETIIKVETETFICPQILSGGESVLFTDVSSSPWRIMVESLKSGERKELVEGDSAQYLSTGHIIYSLENNLMAVPFDVDKLETVAGPVSIIEGVFRQVAPQYAVSDSGTLVYVPGSTAVSQQPSTLVWVDHEGNEDPLAAAPDIYDNIKISPDSTRVALARTVDGNEDIWIWDLVRKTMTRLTFDEAEDNDPIWTPDSQRIIFSSERAERRIICWKAADGTGEVEQIASMEGLGIWPWSVSNDGNTLFFGKWSGLSLYDIGILSLKGERTPKLLLQEEYSEVLPQISPDGRWLAYMSNESGQYEVFIRPFPDVDSGGRWQVSTDGGFDQLWAPDGHELFYVIPDGTMAVSVETEPTFKLGTPRTLPITGPYIDWDISPDGDRFLMLKRVEAEGDESQAEDPSRINIVLNWFEELKERVPVD